VNSMSKVVLVTGGARGIGLGIVHAFAAAGHRVMIADLGASDDWRYQLSGVQELEKAKKEESAIGEVDSCEVNVTNFASCESAVAATVAKFGGLDILVNNAGVLDTGPIETFEEENWDKVFAVNTKGIFLMSKAALGALRASNCGAIVNTASIAGKEGNANMSAYCGSKFAAIGITQALALELAPDDITVNAVCPGIVGTAMWLEHLIPKRGRTVDEQQQKFEDSVEGRIPLGRSQTVEDIAEAALYLANARNVTGIALAVAGGIVMN
jgi:meso-butanediol dehydrogenase/(S,S)-butanediol dehydrogenase/diacetyl reductase